MSLEINTIGLAPMEGVSELATRLFFSLCSSPDTMGTPFLRITRGYKPCSVRKDVFAELFIEPEALPYKLIPQMMGPDADDFSYMAEWLKKYSDVIEINCGCPSPKVFGHGAGSALLENPHYFVNFIETISSRIGVSSLAVKIRTGVESTSGYKEIVDGLSTLPLSHLCIHGRTKKQRYTGKADWNFIEHAQSTIDKYAVIGSGDINDLDSYNERTNCGKTRAIIGRGALRNPWVFEEIRTTSPIIIDSETLLCAVAVYGLLWEKQWQDTDGLIAMIRDGMFFQKIGVENTAWTDIYIALCLSLGISYKSLDEIELSRQGLGKVKLLWNYLRSSLPGEFSTPSFLRATRFSSFCNIYKEINKSRQCDIIVMQYNSQFDWMYAGEKNPRKIPTQASH